MRNGEPFYIKGAAGSGFLEELKTAGGNTFRVYDTVGLEPILDKALELDLAVVVDIPLDRYRKDFEYTRGYTEQMKNKIVQTVKRYKDHPALLYWNLGNEIKYPVYYERTSFFDHFNTLLDAVKATDPHHPVSTTFAGTNRGRINNVNIRSPQLDFLSFQTFGGLHELEDRLDDFLLLWNGPYVVSEWGINGPWETQYTSWKAPIEPTSTKKAEQVLERSGFDVLHNKNSLGNIFFYWGNKHERTSSWFSTFSETGEKYETFYSLRKYWGSDSLDYEGPRLRYALLENTGAPGDIILSPGQKVQAKVLFEQKPRGNASFHWEVKKEAWADEMEKPEPIEQQFTELKSSNAIFRTPLEEGPYRLFYSISDERGNIATTNIPFYILDPEDGE